jgi:S1-C subfamily serine protease
MKSIPRWTGAALLAFLCVLCWGISNQVIAATLGPGADSNSRVADAICPIVYPAAESPENKGYPYIFYGNAFFVSREGYLITATHVLHSFRDGGQPYILVGRTEAPPQLIKAEVVGVDREHDVAVLRATPNPFHAGYRVGLVALGTEGPQKGQGIVVAALRPARKHPQSFEMPLQDYASARILESQFSQLDKGQGETELFLFDHAVILGQSGAPILANGTAEAVGFVEGQWLHPTPAQAGTLERGETSIGAAVPIRYAVALLREKGISWGSGSSH